LRESGVIPTLNGMVPDKKSAVELLARKRKEEKLETKRHENGKMTNKSVEKRGDSRQHTKKRLGGGVVRGPKRG